MKLFRSYWLSKVVICIILTGTLASMFPNEAVALTTGPHQPEYTSYEDGGSSDLVNLLTGDFSFHLPILSVPVGLEGRFPVPLSYHGGIAPDQEASWIGLGWNINVGAITRNINGFPDDANKEVQAVSVKDLTGYKGWNANFLGTSIGWDSQAGHYGVLNLGFKLGYDNDGISSVGIAGISVHHGDVSFDGAEFFLTIVNVVMNILTYGTSSIWLDAAIGLAMDMISPDYTPSVSTQGYWQYSKHTNRKLFHTDYWTWLQKARVEEMYGVLNLDRATTVLLPQGNQFSKTKVFFRGSEQTVQQFARPTGQVFNLGTASDINIDLSVNDSYHLNDSPVSLAYDNYQVNAPGIAGSITPYRLEVGSVSVPREMTSSHVRLSPVNFMNYGTNKVPFRYEGYASNRYYHHLGGNATASKPGTFNFGIATTTSTTTVPAGTNPNVLQHEFNDLIFTTHRVSPEVATKQRFAQGNYIHWLTNAEIKTTTNNFTGTNFLDYFSGTARHSFRNLFEFGGQGFTSESDQFVSGVVPLTNAGSFFVVNQKVDVNVMVYNGLSSTDPAYVRTDAYTNATVTAVSANSISVSGVNNYPTDQAVSVQVISKVSSKPDQSIGGLVITSSEGISYHFSLPIYDYNFNTVTQDKADPLKNSKIFRSSGFANTWLLTGITGPDFIDRGGANGLGNGAIDDNDWGYWIKFNYFKHVTDYKWRLPFSGLKPTPDDLHKTYAEGYKEKYYLNSIETRSHVALFIKDTRNDAKDANNSRTSLRLSEIALLTKENYNQMVTAGLPACSGKIDVGYMASNFSGAIATTLQTKAQRRIIFGNNNYVLCPGTPNYTPGKLTLKSLSVLGRNNAKILPDYVFEYTNNAPYSSYKWDGWGMYSSTATEAAGGHKASNVATDASAWALSRVISPGGAQVVVTYERDTYASISGEGLATPKNGGNGRVGSIAFVDPGGQSYKTRYLYTTEAGTTSGVISQEPEYIRETSYDFYKWMGYPITPVLYSRVEVLTGKLTTDADYTSKQIFQFTTPHKSMYTMNSDVKVRDRQLMSSFQTSKTSVYNDYSTVLKYQISRRISQIGKVSAIEIRDKTNNVFSKQLFSYTESPTNNGVSNFQGVFTEGNLLSELVYDVPSSRYHKVQRTTWIDYPSVLSKITTIVDGQTSDETYKNWDLLTGMVTATQSTNAVGLKIKSVVEPAYTQAVYAEFGSKVNNPNNLNMLTVPAVTYTYKLDGAGNETGLVDATATIWKNDWQNYRKLNATNTYVNDQDLDFNNNGSIDAAEAKFKVWRKYQSYIWKGEYNIMKSDGTHTFTYSSDKFNFSAPGSNAKWQLTGTLARYNHNSLPLEQVDLNGIYTASKLNALEKLTTATGANARYEEIAYSGAEDISGSYVGNEVAIGAGTRVTTGKHTGTYAISTSSNAFIFKSTGLSLNKTYKASVWTNSTNARIYYKLNGGAEILSSAPSTQKQIGAWYLLEFNIPIGATFSSFEVGVKAVTGTALFDDFRFQPLQSDVTGYVYNPDTHLVEYVLNNNNLYTRFEYDNRGILTKTYQESFKYAGEKLVSENKSDFRRFHISQ